jgi:hypothetical protein
MNFYLFYKVWKIVEPIPQLDTFEEFCGKFARVRQKLYLCTP